MDITTIVNPSVCVPGRSRSGCFAITSSDYRSHAFALHTLRPTYVYTVYSTDEVYIYLPSHVYS